MHRRPSPEDGVTRERPWQTPSRTNMCVGANTRPRQAVLLGSASENAQNTAHAPPRAPPLSPRMHPMYTYHEWPLRLRASPCAAREEANKNGGASGGLRRELMRTPPGEQAYLGSFTGIVGT